MASIVARRIGDGVEQDRSNVVRRASFAGAWVFTAAHAGGAGRSVRRQYQEVAGVDGEMRRQRGEVNAGNSAASVGIIEQEAVGWIVEDMIVPVGGRRTNVEFSGREDRDKADSLKD